MAKKENNKKNYDYHRKWQERKKQRNKAKGKQEWAEENFRFVPVRTFAINSNPYPKGN